MIKFFKSPKLPTALFIVASLATFVLFGILYLLLKVNIPATAPEAKQPGYSRYYLNENYNRGDAYITKNPGLGDMLSGPIISESDPGLGKVDAPVIIVEFSDYVCIYCRQQEAIIKQTLNKYGDRVGLIWKDYPENDPFSISWQAAVASRCADEQGYYWEYHDLLYRYSEELSPELFVKLAKELGLDTEVFRECVSGDRAVNLIRDNIQEANALGINGVPFLYVNDQKVLGSVTAEELERLVEIELDKITD